MRLFDEMKKAVTLAPDGSSNVVHLFASHSISKVSPLLLWAASFGEREMTIKTDGQLVLPEFFLACISQFSMQLFTI
jgi:hypothetical protein